MGLVQIMTRSHLDRDRESDPRRYGAVRTESTPESRNWRSIRVSPPVTGTAPGILTHTERRLDRRRPWDTSVTRDLLVKSVIRR